MLQMTVFGVGAAGNKAAINLIEKNIISKEYVKLLNTSSKDIPEQYKNSDIFVPFSSGLGGCGKESSKGKAAIVNAMRKGVVDFGELFNEDSQEVILVSSVEGGTGSGSVPQIAKFFIENEVPTHVFALIGFQDEARGINNTLRFFKELPDGVILHTINNSFFLDYTKNYSKAEQAANDEFATEIEILRGSKLINSSQIIDDADLLKINTAQAGYMTINHIDLSGIKNVSGFNQAIIEAFDNSCYMESSSTCKLIAVIVNGSRKIKMSVDNSYEVIKRYVGTPQELFQHIQPDNDEEYVDSEYIDIIVGGMKYPEESIMDMSSKYKKLKDQLSTKRKSFDDIFADIDVDDMDELDTSTSFKSRLKKGSVDKLFADVPDMEEDTPVKPNSIKAATGEYKNTKREDAVSQQNPMEINSKKSFTLKNGASATGRLQMGGDSDSNN